MLAVVLLPVACSGSCERHLVGLIGALPQDTKVSECRYRRSEDDIRYFELNAELTSSLPFDSVKSQMRTRSDNLSGSERLWLSDLGAYKQTPFEGEFEPRGSIRVEQGYIIVLKELGGGRMRVRVHGAPR